MVGWRRFQDDVAKQTPVFQAKLRHPALSGMLTCLFRDPKE